MVPVVILFIILFSLVQGSQPCPDGYLQAPNGGNCFMGLSYFDNFIGQFYSMSFNEVEQHCNERGGGMLASFHSQEEVTFAKSYAAAQCKMSGNGDPPSIGLRCKGTNCKWDDGSAVTYLQFPVGGPPDDTKTRCYATGKICHDFDKCTETWLEEDPHVDLMSAFAAIECLEGEVEYKGGCVSMHSAPLDQKTAEESCPDGGKLISIHSSTENNFYKNIALNAGLNGTIYIGGRFTNGVFGWTDGSFYTMNTWAPSFPNTIFGSCTQMQLASEFGNQGQWTNIDCNTKQPYLCFRDGVNYRPTVATLPLADPHCPPIQYYTGTGNIISPNFPLSIPNGQTCEYVIGTDEGTKASVSFTSYDCQSGTSLEFYDGLNSYQPFLTFTAKPPTLNQPYTSSSNVMKLIFTANGTAAPTGTGWEAEFRGV